MSEYMDGFAEVTRIMKEAVDEVTKPLRDEISVLQTQLNLAKGGLSVIAKVGEDNFCVTEALHRLAAINAFDVPNASLETMPVSPYRQTSSSLGKEHDGNDRDESHHPSTD